MELITKGRVTTSDLERLYSGRLNNDSIICTDSHKSYIKFGIKYAKQHIRIASGKHKNGVYHISHVNALHSKLKKWLTGFKGVSTKYLSNYLNWFIFVECISTERDIIKTKHLFVNSMTKLTDTRIVNFRGRSANFI